MALRRRKIVQTVEKLDAFSKLPEECTVTSKSGGTISLLTFALLAWLVILEVHDYLTDSSLRFTFHPDKDFTAKLSIHVDMTVATPCSMIGADVTDATKQNMALFGRFDEEKAWFNLSPRQRAYFDRVKEVNSYLRDQYHSLSHQLWKSGYSTLYGSMPSRSSVEIPDTPHDACRIHGTLQVNKVGGNLHVIAGKSIDIGIGHAHISMIMFGSDFPNFNFSHRIDRLWFGQPSSGIIQPLDADEQIADSSNMMYQYFITVVPTEVVTKFTSTTTYQYSVKELHRAISHEKGSHGTPGIYIKYDFSALRVKVSEDAEPLWRFLTRLCAITGGVFATSGIITSAIEAMVDFICCRRQAKEKLHAMESRNMGECCSLLPAETSEVDSQGCTSPLLVVPDSEEPGNSSPLFINGFPASSINTPYVEATEDTGR